MISLVKTVFYRRGGEGEGKRDRKMVNSSHEGVCALMLTFCVRAQTAAANQLMAVDAGRVFTFRAHPSPFHPHCQKNEATDITIAIHSQDNRTLEQATEPECILKPLAYSIMYKTVWWKNLYI